MGDETWLGGRGGWLGGTRSAYQVVRVDITGNEGDAMEASVWKGCFAPWSLVLSGTIPLLTDRHMVMERQRISKTEAERDGLQTRYQSHSSRCISK